MYVFFVATPFRIQAQFAAMPPEPEPELVEWTDVEMCTRKFGHTATMLANGDVLVCGGAPGPASPAVKNAEVCCPSY